MSFHAVTECELNVSRPMMAGCFCFLFLSFRMPQTSTADDLAVAAPRADVRDALRRATAPLHARVDASVPLAKPAPTLADYRDHLHLLRDWTAVLRALPVDPARLDAQAAALAQDIADCDRLLGDGPTVAPAAEPAPVRMAPAAPAAFGWGIAYVIEGSQLGGQVLYRRLVDALAPHPLGYLQGAGHGTGARWTAFLADLRANVGTPLQIDAACAGAVEAFELLLRCQRDAERGR